MKGVKDFSDHQLGWKNGMVGKEDYVRLEAPSLAIYIKDTAHLLPWMF